MSKILIIGNSVAGTYAAKTINDIDNTQEITILSCESYPFYSRPRLPEFLADKIPLEKLYIFSPEFYEKRGINLQLNTQVTSIDAVSHTVTTQDGVSYSYDTLLLANGSSASLPPIEGISQDWVFSLRTIDDVLRIKEYAQGKKEVIVIGGGLLGLEAANGLRQLGLNVRVVEFFDRLLPRQIDQEGSDILKSVFEEIGFCFELGAVTQKVTEVDGVKKVILKDGKTFSADFVLVSAGIKPNIDLAESAGLAVNKGIVVDDFMKTSDKDIYAAGDVAEHANRIYGIWPAADEQGKAAGENIEEKEKKYTGTVLSTKLKVLGIDMASLGDISAEGVSEYKRVDASSRLYQKLFVKDDCIIGAILVGDVKKAFSLQAYIKDKVNIKGYEERILMPDFDLRG